MDMEKYHLEGTKRLARFVVHRMNNLLGGIMGYSEIMLRRAEKEGADTGFLHQIHQIGIDSSDMLSHFYGYLHLWDHQGVVAFEPAEKLQSIIDFLHAVFPIVEFTLEEADTDLPPKYPFQADRQAISEALIHILTDVAHLSNGTSPVRVRYALSKSRPALLDVRHCPIQSTGCWLVCDILPPEGFSFVKPKALSERLNDLSSYPYDGENTILTQNGPFVAACDGFLDFQAVLPAHITVIFGEKPL